MTLYRCNPGVARWRGPYAGSFRPHGRLEQHGRPLVANPEIWESGEATLAGRLIIGFNIGTEPVWSVDDLIPIVRRVRERQVGDPSASFVLQRGIYKHKDPAHDIVEEDGAQVILIATEAETPAAFRRDLVALAEEIARRLEQESVIVEIQENGITQVVLGVGP